MVLLLRENGMEVKNIVNSSIPSTSEHAKTQNRITYNVSKLLVLGVQKGILNMCLKKLLNLATLTKNKTTQ